MSSSLEDVCWNYIEENNFRKAKLFLQNGTKGDKILDYGISIIHLLSGREDCSELLELCLKNGASPNVPTCEGITPVHLAAIWGIYDNLCILLKYKGDPQITDADGLNALDYAYQSSESQAELCVQHLSKIILGDGYLTEISSFDNSQQDSFEVKDTQKLYPSIQACLTDNSPQDDTPYTKLRKLQDDDKHFKFSASPMNAEMNSTYSITYNESPTTKETEFTRDFMTEEEESSSDTLSSGTTSFYTACEGDLTFSALDNTVVTFPKLHPWTIDKCYDDGLDDTVIGNMEKLNMDCCSDSLNQEPSCIGCNESLSNQTVMYDWKEYSILETTVGDTSLVIPDTLLNMSCRQLKKELEDLGEDPGPVREDTKPLYVKRLARLQNGIDTKVRLLLNNFVESGL